MGRKEKIAIIIAGAILFLIIMSKGYGIWVVAGGTIIYLYRKRK